MEPFASLFSLLDKVLAKWDAARKRRAEKERLRVRADAVMALYREKMRHGLLAAGDQKELAGIMRVADRDERLRLLVEFDARARR